MTVQYDGDNVYFIWLGATSIMLSLEEINEIQNFNFINMKEDEETYEELQEKLSDLQQKFEDYKWEIGKLQDEIMDGEIESIDEIVQNMAIIDKLDKS